MGSGSTAEGIYSLVGAYAKSAGIEVAGLGVHGLRATAATNTLEHEADISNTKIYDRRGNRAED